MKWWESVVNVAGRTWWIRTINSGENLLKFKIGMTVETMTMETWLNMHPSYFVPQLNLPAINMVMFHPSSKAKNFLHCNVFFPSLAELIWKAVILTYCVYFPFHSLLIPIKSYIFLCHLNETCSAKDQQCLIQCVSLLLLLLFNISKSFNLFTALLQTLFLLNSMTSFCQIAFTDFSDPFFSVSPIGFSFSTWRQGIGELQESVLGLLSPLFPVLASSRALSMMTSSPKSSC